MTVAGCLTGSPDGRFVLTAVSDERTTHQYVLVGGTDLQAHAGKPVEVVGTVEAKQLHVQQVRAIPGGCNLTP